MPRTRYCVWCFGRRGCCSTRLPRWQVRPRVCVPLARTRTRGAHQYACDHARCACDGLSSPPLHGCDPLHAASHALEPRSKPLTHTRHASTEAAQHQPQHDINRHQSQLPCGASLCPCPLSERFQALSELSGSSPPRLAAAVLRQPGLLSYFPGACVCTCVWCVCVCDTRVCAHVPTVFVCLLHAGTLERNLVALAAALRLPLASVRPLLVKQVCMCLLDTHMRVGTWCVPYTRLALGGDAEAATVASLDSHRALYARVPHSPRCSCWPQIPCRYDE
jgi:hypothetical protein